MSDAAPAPDSPPPPAPTDAPVTSRSDPGTFLWDLDKLAEFIEKLRAAGLKTFDHPSGLRFTYEQSAKLPIRPTEGW